MISIFIKINDFVVGKYFFCKLYVCWGFLIDMFKYMYVEKFFFIF